MVVIKILRTQHLVYRPTNRWNNQKTLAKQYAPFFQEGHENCANEFVCQLFILAKLISLLSSDHIHNNKKQENNFIYKIIFIVIEVKSSTMTILKKNVHVCTILWNKFCKTKKLFITDKNILKFMCIHINCFYSLGKRS